MPASKDPAKRANQLANLTPNAAVKHGAHSAKDIAPLMEKHLARLRERYATADPVVLATQAERAAQIELIAAYLGNRPGVGAVMRNRRTATVWPARDYMLKLQSAYERQIERLDAENGPRTSADAQAIIDAHTGGDDA